MQKHCATKTIFFILVAFLFSQNAKAFDRLYILIVGSSSMFPVISPAAEYFKHITNFKTPIVESNGTGSGFKLFCSGIGSKYPDMVNASRPILPSEMALCKKNNIKNISYIKIGYDGIVLANNKRAPKINLSRKELFIALAKDLVIDGKAQKNPHTTWRQIRADLPDRPIKIFGPSLSSGTRDALVELVMIPGCKAYYDNQKSSQQNTSCKAIRQDGAFIESSDNENLFIQKLIINPSAFGIFSYTFLSENLDKIQATKIDNIDPTPDLIAKQTYPVSRGFYVYLKNDHLTQIPGLSEFINVLSSDAMIGREGLLIHKGLIPLSKDEYNISRATTLLLTNKEKVVDRQKS